MARALRAWAINRGGKNSVRNLQYGPRTRLVRGIYYLFGVFYLSKVLFSGFLQFKGNFERGQNNSNTVTEFI